MKLTLEEAIALRNILEPLCISYYEVDARVGLKKTIEYLDNIIEEFKIYIAEEVFIDDEAISLIEEENFDLEEQE